MAARPKHIVEYALLRGVLGFLNLLPRRVALVLTWPLAGLGFLLMRKRVREAKRRMREVLGADVTPAQLRRWAWISWRNILFNIVEMAQLPYRSRSKVPAMYVRTDLPECTKLTAAGRGYTVAVCHMGNWDLASVVAQHLGLPLFILMRTQSNPLVNDYMEKLRVRLGVETVDRHARVLGSVIKRIRAGEVFTILPDIRAKTLDSAIEVPYLGGMAYLNAGMGLFAKQTETPVVPVVVRRVGWFRHELEEHAPVYPDPALDKREDIVRITTEVMAVFDRAVRETPEQYFWYNKRWVLDRHFG